METARPHIALKSGGFAAAQSLIGAAIVAATAMVMMGILGNLSELSSRYMVKEQQTSATFSIQALLMHADTCATGLKGSGELLYTGDRVINIPAIYTRDALGVITPMVGSNSVYEVPDLVTRVNIGPMTLEPLVTGQPPLRERHYPNNDSNWVEYDSYLARLVIPAAMDGQYNPADPSNRLKNHQITLKLLVETSTGSVARCFSVGNDGQICRSFGGTINVNTGQCELPACDENNLGPMGAQQPVPDLNLYRCLDDDERDDRATPCPNIDRTPFNPNDRIYVWLFDNRGDPALIPPPLFPWQGRAPSTTQMVCKCIQACK